MADPNVEAVKVTGDAQVPEGQGAAPNEPHPATLADRLAAGLIEFFTRRRQNRPGLYAPLVRLDRGE